MRVRYLSCKISLSCCVANTNEILRYREIEVSLRACDPGRSQAGMSGELKRRRSAPRRLVGTREEKDSRLSIQFCQRKDPRAVTSGSSRDLSRSASLLTRWLPLADRCPPLEARASPTNATNKLASSSARARELLSLAPRPLIGLLNCAQLRRLFRTVFHHSRSRWLINLTCE